MTHYIKTKPSSKKKETKKQDDLLGLIGATALAVALFGAMIWFIIFVLTNGAV